jgi:hypothetical protein
MWFVWIRASSDSREPRMMVLVVVFFKGKGKTRHDHKGKRELVSKTGDLIWGYTPGKREFVGIMILQG